jgi:hypothetical protein
MTFPISFIYERNGQMLNKQTNKQYTNTYILRSCLKKWIKNQNSVIIIIIIIIIIIAVKPYLCT